MGADVLQRNRYAGGMTWAAEIGLAGRRPAYSTDLGATFTCDALDLLHGLPDDCIDLVLTSPPFPLTRQKEYGNEPLDRYVAWLLPFCREIRRVLRPTGSFVLDLGGSWESGAPVRSLYHFEIAIRLAREFKLAQEFYWYNPSRLPTPAEWVTIHRVRVKDAVNMVWWFGKTEHPKADNRKVLQPYSPSMRRLLRDGYEARRRPSGHDISRAFRRDNGGAIPPNLLNIPNTGSNSAYLRACRARNIAPHPARFPDRLVRFFVDFLTDPGDLVLDPFAGSNVTGAVCESCERRWLACDVNPEYVEGSAAHFDEGTPARTPARRVGRAKKARTPR
jgi:site-specific DNA-methyltransferase (cytosine-N4-specific)